MPKTRPDLVFVTSVMLALMLFLGPLATPALADDDDDEGGGQGLGFHFVAQSVDPAAGTAGHSFFMTGTGRFDDEDVTGGGFFDHFDNATGLLAAGKWRAKRLVSFAREAPLNPFIPLGFLVSGILVAEVRLFPAGGPPNGIPATLTVVCNVGAVGAFTGLPEGYFLDFDGLSFAPVTPAPVVGITAFSTDPGGGDDDDDD